MRGNRLPFLVATVVLALCRPAQADTGGSGARATAGRLEGDGRRIRLEGQVRLEWGRCRLQANELDLDLQGRRLVGQQARLDAADGSTLWANRLCLGPEGLFATHLSGALCACPGRRSLLRFTAASARVGPDGRRLHLRWPVLRLGPVPLLALPYVALPLEPGVSGLLLPVVGYSGRDGLRLEQGIYLAPSRKLDLLLAGGWIQRRGGVGRLRLRGHGEREELELGLVGLRDGEVNRGELRGRLAARGAGGWAAALAPDLVSDPDLPADLSSAVERIYAPHLRSRAWTWARWQALSGELTGDLHQDLRSPLAAWDGVAGLRVGLAPTRILGPLYGLLRAEVMHWGGIGGDRPEGEAQATWIHAAPALGLASALGPLRLSARGTYRVLAGWDLDGEHSDPDPVIHAGILGLESSLPLARDFGKAGRWRHLVEPLVGLEWAGAQLGSVSLPDGVTVAEGGAALFGLRSEVLLRRAGPVRRVLQTRARLELPLAPEAGRELLVGGELGLIPTAALSSHLSAAWAPGPGRLAELQGRLCLHGRLGGGLFSGCARYARLRLRRVEELWGTAVEGAWRPLGPGLLPLELAPHQVSGSLTARWEPLSGGAQLAWDPVAAEVTTSGVWLDLALGCGCYRVGVAGATRAGQRWPDVVARLSFAGGGLRCNMP